MLLLIRKIKIAAQRNDIEFSARCKLTIDLAKITTVVLPYAALEILDARRPGGQPWSLSWLYSAAQTNHDGKLHVISHQFVDQRLGFPLGHPTEQRGHLSPIPFKKVGLG